jgi:hypothetical protein
MYTFKNELKHDLLDGRTITYVAKKIAVSIGFLTSVLNGKSNCSKLLALAILGAVKKPTSDLEVYFNKKEVK